MAALPLQLPPLASCPRVASVKGRTGLCCYGPRPIRRSDRMRSPRRLHFVRSSSLTAETAAAGPEPEPSAPPVAVEGLEGSIAVMKTAAKTRKVPPAEVYAALRVVGKAKLDPSSFLATIGGSPEAPGARTWMLIFTASKEGVSVSLEEGAGGGSYFPITAIQKFDATAMTIENGVYLGPLGCLTFQGRMSWKNRIMAFLFETINIKFGSLGPFKFNIEKKEDQGRTPNTKDPFFIWLYADEEIIVGKGRSGGVALWCRCTRVSQ